MKKIVSLLFSLFFCCLMMAQGQKTDISNLPIGVFDSGTGGFTVLEKILAQDLYNNQTGARQPDGIPDFAHEDVEYVGDLANMPYGRYDAEGNAEYLRELAVNDARFLLGEEYWKDASELRPTGKKQPVKIVVIACNTATAYGLEPIQQMLKSTQGNTKVIGVVNAGARAVISSLGGQSKATIGVLATPGTISSGVYERTLRQLAPQSLTLTIINETGDGFAEAVDELTPFVDRKLKDFSSQYEGPQLSNADDGAINPYLLDAYHFNYADGGAFIERNAQGKAVRIQLNSGENYARYNLLSLIERARKQHITTPMSRIIMGCTHYPFYLDVLKKHLDELRNYQDTSGNKPYAAIIADDCQFVDPAENTAYECYQALLNDRQLNQKLQSGTLLPFVSVPSAHLPAECLDSEGNLTYAFKYGRKAGSNEITTVFVPLTEQNIGTDNLQRIDRMLPLCSERIHSFMAGPPIEEQAVQKEPFTAWLLFVDMGIIAVLLLVGKLIRVKIRWIQQLFIPPSLIAGFLGLALGPNGFELIPLSEYTGVYASILIACIFSCLPFSSGKGKAAGNNVGRMWLYSQCGLLLQWTLGGIMGLFILKLIWPWLNSAFGLSLPAGFCGGHGTAAALGTAFQTYHYEDMLTLAMTSATVGVVAAVIVGLLIIKRGTEKGLTSFLTNFNDLPHEYRAGLLPEEKRTSIGTNTCSSISIDSLTFNFAIVMMVALGGYALSLLVKLFVPELSLPVFSCAFLVGIAAVMTFRKLGVDRYICTDIVSHLSGTFTDILVVCGIASIKLSVVMDNLVPLIVLLVTGLIVTYLYVFVVARHLMPDYWFEKAIFTWGWFTGTMAMGIALLRVVDPEQRSRCLEDYALAYLFIAPVEICLVTFAPIAFMTGWGWAFIGACTVGIAMILAFGWAKGWLKK